MKKHIILFLLSVISITLFNSCKSTTTIETIPTQFEVPLTGISPIVVYAEVYVPNEPQGDISITKNNFYYKLKNLSHTYQMNLTFMICLEGDAKSDATEIYTSKQSRWNDSSKTIVLADTTINQQETKNLNTVLNNANSVLLKLLNQNHFFVIVRNEIPAATYSTYTNTPTATGTTQTIKITYPSDNAVLRDGKIRIRGIYNNSLYSASSLSVTISSSINGAPISYTYTSVNKNGNTWYCDIDLIGIPNSDQFLGSDFSISAKIDTASLLHTVSHIKFSPALDVNDFYAELQIESEAFGVMSLFSIF